MLTVHQHPCTVQHDSIGIHAAGSQLSDHAPKLLVLNMGQNISWRSLCPFACPGSTYGMHVCANKEGLTQHLFSKHNQELAPYTTCLSPHVKMDASMCGATHVMHLVRLRPRILFRPKDLVLLGAEQAELDYQPYDFALDYHKSFEFPITTCPAIGSSRTESKQR